MSPRALGTAVYISVYALSERSSIPPSLYPMFLLYLFFLQFYKCRNCTPKGRNWLVQSWGDNQSRSDCSVSLFTHCHADLRLSSLPEAQQLLGSFLGLGTGLFRWHYSFPNWSALERWIYSAAKLTGLTNWVTFPVVVIAWTAVNTIRSLKSGFFS